MADQENEKCYVFRIARFFNVNLVDAQALCTTRSAGCVLGNKLMANNFKQILRSSTNSSFRTVCPSPGRTWYSVQDDPKTLAHALKFIDGGPLSVPVHGHVPTPAPPKFIYDLLENAKPRAMMRQPTLKEAKYFIPVK